MPAPSVCFWMPRLSLGHPGSLTPEYGLKCMRPQAALLLNVPHGRRENRDQVSFPRIHKVVQLVVEPTTLRYWVQRANHWATVSLIQVQSQFNYMFVAVFLVTQRLIHKLFIFTKNNVLIMYAIVYLYFVLDFLSLSHFLVIIDTDIHLIHLKFCFPFWLDKLH